MGVANYGAGLGSSANDLLQRLCIWWPHDATISNERGNKVTRGNVERGIVNRHPDRKRLIRADYFYLVYTEYLLLRWTCKEESNRSGLISGLVVLDSIVINKSSCWTVSPDLT